tara:strand:+ start:305 stop:979 length:675 start_codon:yes stop_codon:yes gene_type:complete
MRYIILAIILGGLLIVGMFGSRGHKFKETPVELFNDMDRQDRVNAQSTSDFFADGVGARKPVEGTYPIGFSIPDKPFSEGDAVVDGFSLKGTYFNSGQLGDYYGEGLPKEIKLDKEFLDRGKQRYGIYCAVCHADSGDGNGVIRPFGNGGPIPIANLHEARFAESSYPNGEIFSVITMGRGLMGGYGGAIPAKDRWAIIAYVRALQKTKINAEKSANKNDTASK